MYFLCKHHIGKGNFFSIGVGFQAEKILNENDDAFGKSHRQNALHIALLIKGRLEGEFLKDGLKLSNKGGEALQKKVL